MLAKIIILVSLVVAASALRSENDDFNAFMEFVKKYNKSYTTIHEFQARFRVFQTSLDRVEQRHSKQLAAGRNSTVWGVTKFSDLTPAEFKAQYLGSQPPRTADQHVRVHLPTAGATPTSLDWRTKGAVTPVKDQQQCGSCWAFSATETIESQAFMNGGQLLVLSPQQIVSCDTTDDGCDGGWPYSAYQYVQSAGGITSNADYPYTSGGGNTGTCQLGKDQLLVSVSGYSYAVTPCYDSCTGQNEGQLLNNLVSKGPISVCVDAEPWQDYVNGVFMGSDCESDYDDLDHCVQAVGYNREVSTPYWIVRNSWNTDWGIDGYIWIEYGVNGCGIADSATIPVAKQIA